MPSAFWQFASTGIELRHFMASDGATLCLHDHLAWGLSSAFQVAINSRTATAQFLCNLRCLQPKAVQFGYPIMQGVFAVSSCPALLPVLVGIQLRFEWIHILAMQISALLEAHLKS